MRKIDLLFAFLLLPVDFFMVEAAGAAAYFLRVSPWIATFRPVLFYENLPPFYYAMLVTALALGFMALFAFAGLYEVERRHMLTEFFSVALCVSGGIMVIIIAMFFNRAWFDSRFILLAGWAFSLTFVVLGRIFLRWIRHFVVEQLHNGKEAIALIGSGDRLSLMKDAVETDRGLRLVGVYPRGEAGVLQAILTRDHIDRVILTDSDIPRTEIMELAYFCEDRGIRFAFVPDLFGALSAQMQMEAFGGIPLLELKRTPLDGWGKITKRTLDIIGAIGGMIVFSPLFAIIALAIIWESKGPILVRLRRVSQGKEFNLLKFRSMIDNAEAYKPYLVALNERSDGPLFKKRNDPRVTRVGKFLRERRFDELPQLINVLQGSMNLVGPRPHEPSEVAQYERHHKKVFALKPGITGPAQISGASSLPFEEEVKIDTYYVEHWSLKRDAVILLRTFFLLLFDRSGY